MHGQWNEMELDIDEAAVFSLSTSGETDGRVGGCRARSRGRLRQGVLVRKQRDDGLPDVIERRTLKQALEGGIVQLNLLPGVHHHDGKRAVLDERVEKRSPLGDPVFQVVMRLLQQ